MFRRTKMLILASLIALTATLGVVAAVTHATARAVPVALGFGGPGPGSPGPGCTLNGGGGVINPSAGGALCQ